MKKVKIGVCLMLAMLMVMPGCGVMAAVNNGASVISPMYANMNSITASISISDSTATCKGSYTMDTDKKSVMIMTLQRRTSSGAFTEYKTWTEEYSGTGKHSMTKTKSSLPTGYYYRTKVEVQIYSGETMIEAGAYYSSEKKH